MKAEAEQPQTRPHDAVWGVRKGGTYDVQTCPIFSCSLVHLCLCLRFVAWLCSLGSTWQAFFSSCNLCRTGSEKVCQSETQVDIFLIYFASLWIASTGLDKPCGLMWFMVANPHRWSAPKPFFGLCRCWLQWHPRSSLTSPYHAPVSLDIAFAHGTLPFFKIVT